MLIASFTALLPLALLAGSVVLQVFLSRREGRLPGLILPCLAFLYSLLSVLSVAALPGMAAWDVFCAAAGAFLSANLPTAVLLGIYFACREKARRKKQLDKMNIQDLK